MTLEEQILELHRNMQTYGVEERLLPEAREKLEDIARRSAMLNLEMAEVVTAEAARLAVSKEDEQAYRDFFGLYVLRLTTEEGFRLAPENLSANHLSM